MAGNEGQEARQGVFASTVAFEDAQLLTSVSFRFSKEYTKLVEYF